MFFRKRGLRGDGMSPLLVFVFVSFFAFYFFSLYFIFGLRQLKYYFELGSIKTGYKDFTFHYRKETCMAKGIQAKPLFIPDQKVKRVKFSMEVSSDLLEDLKLYTTFLNESGHEFKVDDVAEKILNTISKDRVFAQWKKSYKPDQAIPKAHETTSSNLRDQINQV